MHDGGCFFLQGGCAGIVKQISLRTVYASYFGFRCIVVAIVYYTLFAGSPISSRAVLCIHRCIKSCGGLVLQVAIVALVRLPLSDEDMLGMLMSLISGTTKTHTLDCVFICGNGLSHVTKRITLHM